MWSALVRTWDAEHGVYRTLTLRVEETDRPGWMLRLYDGRTVVAQILADSPQAGMDKAVEITRAYLGDCSITEDELAWVQARAESA